MTKTFTRAVAVALLFGTAVVPVVSQGEDKAPFGLEWLASADDIAALGVSLSPMEMGDFGKSFVAIKLPKALSDMETVALSFGYTDQLWRVAVISRKFDNDQFGFAAKARYAELEASLSKAYTEGSKYHHSSTDSFYGKPENFAYALDQSEAYWYSLYSSPSSDIELSIGASGSRDTHWRLIYSHREGEAAFNAGKADVELDAL